MTAAASGKAPSVAYKQRRARRAHLLRERDQQPGLLGYSGVTLCGFVLRGADAVSMTIVAESDLCGHCARSYVLTAPTDGPPDPDGVTWLAVKAAERGLRTGVLRGRRRRLARPHRRGDDRWLRPATAAASRRWPSTGPARWARAPCASGTSTSA